MMEKLIKILENYNSDTDSSYYPDSDDSDY